VNVPAHCREDGRNFEIFKRLSVEATKLAGRYGHPVYLCGSALIDHNEFPRDWDVRMMLPDDEFAAHFGSAESPLAEYEETLAPGEQGDVDRAEGRGANEWVT